MTMRFALTYLLLCAFGYGFAAAQPATERPPEPQDDAAVEASEQDTPAPEEKKQEKMGDIITLKTGGELHGIQIIDENPRILTIQVTEGAPPMVLQRKFVEAVIYDKINPSRKGRPGKEPTSAELNVIIAKKVSHEFGKKLGQALSDEPLVYAQVGFMRLVRQLAEKVNATFEITEATKSIPMEERKRDFNIKAKTSLFSFLQEDFATAYPKLEVVYRYNKLVITTKEDAKAMAAKQKQDDSQEASPTPDSSPNSQTV